MEGLVVEPSIDLSLFQWRLAETIAWCVPRLTVTKSQYSLRTPALLPQMIEYTKTEHGYSTMNPYISSTMLPELLNDLSTKRGTLLRQENRYPSAPAQGLASGRLLFFAPDDNLADGAAMVDSEGFFDVDNVPPWDTWVWYHGSYLISWVPPQLIASAERGICVNPEACIEWLDRIDSPLAHQLRAASILRWPYHFVPFVSCPSFLSRFRGSADQG